MAVTHGGYPIVEVETAATTRAPAYRPSSTAISGLIGLGFLGSYFGVPGTLFGMALGFIIGTLVHRYAAAASP
jgi:hypothetical protein